MDAPACWNCAFWNKHDHRESLDDSGDCRRRAPIAIHVVTRVDREDERAWESPDTTWPLTYHYDWCGEYEQADSSVMIDREREQP